MLNECLRTKNKKKYLRQDLAKKLAKKAGLMIVASDNNSKNTKNFLKISKKNTSSIFISDTKFLNKKIIGASTPIKSREVIINFIKKNMEIKKLTKEALEKFKKELEILETVERKKVAEKLKHAISCGDLRENAAYHEAKNAQSFLEGRILELKRIISQSRIIERKASDRVEVGSIVTLKTNGKTEKFQIVEPEEADPLSGKISYRSPLGQLIFGKKKGAKIELKTANGKEKYEILEIS